MGAAAVVAISRMREREIVDEFRAAGALSPATAQSYTAVGLGQSLALRRLHNRAVIREAAPGLYYLDEEVWDAVRGTRVRIALVLSMILVVLLIGIALGVTK
jgi:hypothetical protein